MKKALTITAIMAMVFAEAAPIRMATEGYVDGATNATLIAAKAYTDVATNVISLLPGPQGPQGPQGPKGDAGEVDPAMLDEAITTNATIAAHSSQLSQLSQDILAAAQAATNYTDAATNAIAGYTPDATDPGFSNAVISVALPVSTNELAVLREIGGLPLGEGAATVGGLLAALAAAVAWLKRKTSDIETAVGLANADLETALGSGEEV